MTCIRDNVSVLPFLFTVMEMAFTAAAKKSPHVSFLLQKSLWVQPSLLRFFFYVTAADTIIDL